MDEQLPDGEAIENLRRRLADYAMALDLMSTISAAISEDQVVEGLFELCASLFGPALMVFVPIHDGVPGEAICRPSSDPPPPEALAAIVTLVGDYAWTDSGEGFLLRIHRGNETLGVILVESFAFPGHREDYLNLGIALVGVLSLGLINARVHERLEVAATTDELTGIANRRVVMERLAVEFSRSARSHESMALLMIDIDHFKAFNDQFGHAVGDQVLKMVARCLQESVRPYDLVGRIGGEEFLVIAPGLELLEAEQMAERLRRSVGGVPLLSVAGTPTTVTLSVGVAVSGDHTQVADQLLAHADEALYQAKRRGRNTVSTWGAGAAR